MADRPARDFPTERRIDALSRRLLGGLARVAVGGGTVAAWPCWVGGQEVATPAPEEGSQYRPQETVGSPEPQVAGAVAGEETVGPPVAAVDADDLAVAPFVALSAALVGGGRLDPARAPRYLAIAGADPATRDSSARELSGEILALWHTGVVVGQPVTGREAFWFGLSAWQGVRYTPATSAWKVFGAWATAPETP